MRPNVLETFFFLKNHDKFMTKNETKIVFYKQF